MIRACKHCGTSIEGLPSKQSYCSKSCGAHASKNRQHGLTDTIEHRAWARIRRRCNSPTYHNYPRYGGRGIKVCPHWDVFQNFLADMGPRPTPRHSIERINNDGDYEPPNCKWGTKLEQSRNRSCTYTAEEDRKIREAITLGYTFRQMAAHVGRPERAVMGRTYRLGLHSGTPPAPKKNAHPGSQHPCPHRGDPA